MLFVVRVIQQYKLLVDTETVLVRVAHAIIKREYKFACVYHMRQLAAVKCTLTLLM